jgi:hypothetical protein
MKRARIAVIILQIVGCRGLSDEPKPAPSTDKVKDVKMDDKAKFEALADQWAAHCRKVMFSSKTSDYLDHSAYRDIVAMGEPAVPFVIERYRTEDLPWSFALQEITGVQMMKNPADYRPKDLKKRWIEWWEQKQNEAH